MQQQPIRVAHVIGKVVHGGVEAVVMNYYRHIDRDRLQFDFFIDGLDPTPLEEEILAMGGRVFKLPPYDVSMMSNLKYFKKIIRINSYKIVISHMNTLSVFWLREAKRAGVPIRIAYSHSTSHWREGVRTWTKYALRPFSRLYPTHFLACGEYAGRWLFGDRVFNAGKVTILPNAIKVDKFKFNSKIREEKRDELGLHGKFVVGHVGRFMYQKNHKYLIAVFSKIYQKNKNTVLMLVGDGPLRPEIEQLVAEMGLSESILFLGTRKDVNELYQAMDVFVLPSFYEGFPVVVVEAQAAGLPCFVSNQVTNEVVIVSHACKQLPINHICVSDWCDSVLNALESGKALRMYDNLMEILNITIKAQMFTDLIEKLYFSNHQSPNK